MSATSPLSPWRNAGSKPVSPRKPNGPVVSKLVERFDRPGQVGSQTDRSGAGTPKDSHRSAQKSNETGIAGMKVTTTGELVDNHDEETFRTPSNKETDKSPASSNYSSVIHFTDFLNEQSEPEDDDPDFIEIPRAKRRLPDSGKLVDLGSRNQMSDTPPEEIEVFPEKFKASEVTSAELDSVQTSFRRIKRLRLNEAKLERLQSFKQILSKSPSKFQSEELRERTLKLLDEIEDQILTTLEKITKKARIGETPDISKVENEQVGVMTRSKARKVSQSSQSMD